MGGLCACSNETAISWSIGALFMLCGAFSGIGGILLGAAVELGAEPSEAGASGIGTAGIMFFVCALGFFILGNAAVAFHANTFEKKNDAAAGEVSPV